MKVLAIFRWSDAFYFLEHTAEVLRIFKAEPIGYLRYAFSSCKTVFGELDYKQANVVAGSVTSGLFYHIAKIIWRHAQLIGAILDGRQAVVNL